MASTTTSREYVGTGDGVNGTDLTWAYTFQSYQVADVKVEVTDSTGLFVNVTNFTIPDYSTAAGTVTFNNTGVNSNVCESSGAPKSGRTIRIYRDTDITTGSVGEYDPKATYVAGASVKAGDLNNNSKQALYAVFESKDQEVQTADIRNDAIITAKIKDDAVTSAKLDTNIDIAGTLDVTGATKLDSTLVVDGTTTLNGATTAVNDVTLKADSKNFYVRNAANESKFHVASSTGNTTIQGSLTVVGDVVLSNGSIGNAEIGSDAVDGSKIADNAIGAEHISANSVGTSELQANAVTSNEIANEQVTHSKIGLDAVDGTNISDNSIDSEHYAAGSIDLEHMSANSVDSDQYVDGSIDLAHMSANSVDSDQYVDGSIDAIHIANNAVTSGKLDTNIDIAGTLDVTGSATFDSDVQIKADNKAFYVRNAASEAKFSVDSDNGNTTIQGTLTVIGGTTLANDSISVNELADAELKTLAGMQSGTASKLAGGTALTSDIADLNQIDGLAKQTTITDDDAKFPTSGAVVEYVAAQIAPLGGLEVIATDAAFPNTQPAAGVVISIADAGGLVVNGSGTSTTGRTVGASTVTINGINSQFNSTTVDAGVAMMVSSTGSGQIYNYHKATLKEADLLSLSGDINDFAERYKVAGSAPNTDLDDGDLWWDTSTDKLKVYNGSAFEEVASSGNFYINTISSYSGTGGNSATFDGSAWRFVLSNAGSDAQQHIVSINGVIQKPNSGTSKPSEGFAIDGTSILLSDAPASGSDYFIVTVGSAVSIGTPSNNTVSSAVLQNGAVIQDKLGDQSVNEAKLQISNNPTNGQFLSAQSGNTGGLTWADASVGGATGTDYNDDVKVRFGTGNDLEMFWNGTQGHIIAPSGRVDITADSFQLVSHDTGARAIYLDDANDRLELGFDGNHATYWTSTGVEFIKDVKFDGATAGRDITFDRSDNALEFSDLAKATFGDGADLQIQHDTSGTDKSSIVNLTGDLDIIVANNGGINMKLNSSENAIKCIKDGAIELYHDNSLSLKTDPYGIIVTAPTTSNASTVLIKGFEAKNAQLILQADEADDGPDVYKILGSTDGSFYIQDLSNGSSYETNIKVTGGAGVELYHNNVKKCETTSAGVTITGDLTVTGSAPGGGVTSDAQNNTVAGDGAGADFTGTDANSNTLIGKDAGAEIETGDYNTAVGHLALATSTNSDGQTAIGYGALRNCENGGYNNTAVGNSALYTCTTGDDNTALGKSTLGSVGTGSKNTGLGREAGAQIDDGDENTCVGYRAGYAIDGATGNTAVGSQALLSCVSQGYTTAVGYRALATMVSGATSNVAVGYKAMEDLTTADDGVAVGAGALQNVTEGVKNVAVGAEALATVTTGQKNTALGYGASYKEEASDNTAVGYNALYNHETNGKNTAVGAECLNSTVSGTEATAIGYQAGNDYTANGGVFVGRQAGKTNATDQDTILYIARNNQSAGNNGCWIYGNDTGQCFNGDNDSHWATTSDQRLKKDIVDNNVGLDIINNVRVRNFKYKQYNTDSEGTVTTPKTADDTIDVSSFNSGTIAHNVVIGQGKTGTQIGVIAQELESVAPNCVRTDDFGAKTVQDDELFWHMINAKRVISKS